MKIPFGFERKSGKKELFRDLSEEEYMDEEYIDEEYADDEYMADEYAEEEYSDEEYAEEYIDEYADEEDGEPEYAEAESDEEECFEGEYIDDEFSDEEYIENEVSAVMFADEFDETSYEDDEYAIDSYERENSYDEYDYEDEYEDEYDDEKEAGLLPFFNTSDLADKLITIGGAAILLVGLIVGGLFIHSRMSAQGDNEFLNVGNQLNQIEVIGQSGLLAVSDAQRAALEAAEIVEVEEETSEYEEEEYKTELTVKLSMSSIEKDLKIKFINQETGKLVGNVPFSIQITAPDGKETLWSDDDMDGIIYKKNLKAGKYIISVNAFEDEKYKKYGLPLGEQKVEVKAEIEYKKVDVANEVKTESQVDVQKEDTKKNETVVEGYLTDTVPWVESTATLVSYTEVAKENIVNPMQLALNTSFVRLAADNTISGDETNTSTPTSSPSPEVSESPIPTPSPSPEVSESPTASPSPEVSESPTPTPSPSPEVSESPTPTPSPSPEVSESPTASPSPEVSESPTPSPTPEVSESPSPSPTITPTPTPKPMVITLDQKTVTVYMDNPVTVTVKKVENEMDGAVITANSSNTGVATVSVKDKKITVTGVAAGEATITVNSSADVKVSEVQEDGTVTEKTQTFKADPVTCTVVVKVNPQKDTTTVLKDKQGREVYVMENQNYRVATHADYYTHSKFYIKGEAKYTGWQTMNGKRYFYDASGKAVTGEQVIQGVKYNFASDGSLVTGSGTLGIDVSKWNGNIDWTAVKNSGVSYVIIRCGYRGSSQGALIKDSKFESNIKGAINAGLKVGVYFFSQAIDKNEAVEEASMVLDCIKNYKISYPVFLDVEPSGGRADGISVATRTEVCKAFCETIQSYGYTAGIYANKNWFTEKINTSELSGKYKIWLAQYASAPTYTGRYDMWQYKSTGKISGISGDVDMNLSYLGY